MHTSHVGHYINPFHKSLQNYNDFVLTVTRLNGDMNYSLAVVRLPIRNLAHTIVAVRGTFEVMTSKWFCFEFRIIFNERGCRNVVVNPQERYRTGWW